MFIHQQRRITASFESDTRVKRKKKKENRIGNKLYLMLFKDQEDFSKYSTDNVKKIIESLNILAILIRYI